MVGAVEVTLADALAHLVERAVETFGAADAASVTVRRDDDGPTRAASGDEARRLEARQDELGEGPRLDAAAHGALVVTADLGADPRWPRLAAEVRGGRLRSALVLPLRSPTGRLGTLSLWAEQPGAFGERDDLEAMRFAGRTAATVRNALVLDRARRLTSQLHLGVADRAAVDRAIAVLMRENGVGLDEAYAVLRLLGRTEHEDLVVVARAIVAAEEAAAEPADPGQEGQQAPHPVHRT